MAASSLQEVRGGLTLVHASEHSLCMHVIATEYRIIAHTHHPEAEFLDVIGTKVFLLALHSHLYKQILLPPAISGLKLVCNENIVHGNLKSENSQDYDQKSTKLYVH